MPTDELNFYEESLKGTTTKEPAVLTDSEEITEDNIEVADNEMSEPPTVDLSDIDIGTLEDDESEDEDGEILSSEERLRLFSDKILASCIDGKEISKYALDKLTSITNPRLFRDENYILFSIYYFYRSRLRYIKIDDEFIKLFLNRNRSLISKSRDYIDINAYGDVDGSTELGYISGVIKHFNRLKTLPDLSVEEFETCFEKYLIEFKAIEANKVFRKAQLILSDGLKVGRKTLSGFEDSQNYCKKKLAEIEGLVDFSVGTGFTKMSEVIMEEKPDNKKPIKIGDFGRIAPLNEAYGGIYTGVFYSFVAPPKAGKSKLSARLCHNIAMVNGNNISVWAQEGGQEAWTAQMRAIHFDYIYNTDVDLLDRKYGVSQDVILKDNFKTEELRQLELSSKLDLASNQNYGSIDYIDRPFNVETFLDDIETSIRENNSKAVVIDYLQLIESEKGLNERERISEAYIKLLRFCRKNNVAIISPAQIKQESFNELIKKNSMDNVDMRTSAGGSSQVLRTPDVLFAMWATIDDLRNNSMKIISLPCRMNAAFPNINLRVDLSSCQFISVD